MPFTLPFRSVCEHEERVKPYVQRLSRRVGPASGPAAGPHGKDMERSGLDAHRHSLENFSEANQEAFFLSYMP